MTPTLSTLTKTVVGKTLTGLVVVSMSVGAAAAAGADVPILTSPDDDGTEETASAADTSVVGDDIAENVDEGSDVGEGSEGEHPDNHGAVVSEFTRSTDLEGCAKGQATAAVARGDVDPLADSFADDLAPFLDKCGIVEASEPDASEAETEDGDEEVDWKTVKTEGRDGWHDLRDETKADWHEAKAAFVEACGDDDEDGGEDAGADGGEDDGELSDECRQMKDELKQLHRDGKAEWKAARDAAKAEWKAAKHGGNKGNRGNKGGRSGK
jgi:hypothetical protein